jgi:hypothetical protein
VFSVGEVNVGTVGVVTVGDAGTLVDDGLVIDGDVFSVDGDVPSVVDVGPVLPIAPVVPVTPLKPVDANVVLVGDAGDEPIELVGAGIVDGIVGVGVDGDIVGEVDGSGAVNVVGGLGDVRTGDVPALDVATLGLDMVPGPGMHGNGAVRGADCVDVVGLIGSVLPA